MYFLVHVKKMYVYIYKCIYLLEWINGYCVTLNEHYALYYAEKQVPFWWNDNDDVSVVLDQHVEPELRWPGMVIRFFSSSCAYRVNIITNSLISLDWGKARELFSTNVTYRWIWLASFRFLEKPQYGIWKNKGTSRWEEEHSLNPLNACI